MRGITLVALCTMLVAGTGTGDENRTFFYGQLIDINPGSRIITVRGDDQEKWRFKIVASTEFQKDLKQPVPATFQDLKVGIRVRVLGGSPTANPTVREAVHVFVYP
jgi:hypothetical protein